MSETIHEAAHARAIAEALEAVSTLDARLEFYGCHLRGAVELWSMAGFRLGVMRFIDDCWRFEILYAEDGVTPEEER